MLLSSVNFVAKAKTGKSKDGLEKKNEKKDLNKTVNTATESMCRMCRKELDDEDAIFKFPSAQVTGSDKQSIFLDDVQSQNTQNVGSRVSVATGDDMCLTVDQFYYTIGLKDESQCDNTCIFRKKVLKSKVVPNGHTETVVFVLDCDRDFYITTNKQRELELNYFAKSPNENTQDDRIFEIYFTNVGHCLIQPLHHKNAYLHHLDAALSVQPLDLNWRCPEEYFFHFNAVPEPVVYKKKRRVRKICTHQREQIDLPLSQRNSDNSNDSNLETNTDSDKAQSQTWSLCNSMNAQLMKEMPERFYIEIPTRKSCKNKNTLSNLFLGCFGGKSSRLVVGSS